jgi:hypothetical protein
LAEEVQVEQAGLALMAQYPHFLLLLLLVEVVVTVTGEHLA